MKCVGCSDLPTKGLRRLANAQGEALVEIDVSLASVRYNRPLTHFLSMYRGYRIFAAEITLQPWSGYHKHTLVQAVEAIWLESIAAGA